MKTMEYIYFLSFFVSVLLGALSFAISRKFKSSEFSHLTEFWGALASMMAISYIFRKESESMLAFTFLGWVWPLKTMMQIAQDMSGQVVVGSNRLKVIILGVGGFATLALYSYQYEFMKYATPFCLATGLVGVVIIKDAYTKGSKQKFSILGHASFVLLACFFLLYALYPLWRMSELRVFCTAANLLILAGLASSTLSFYMEVMKEKHEQQLEGLLKERNDQLFGQSKYSELGMMSAGIAHEINNPLAIIQAKVTQLLRIHRDPNRLKEVSQGLEQILYTSERINRTIQGVRDFVHQDDMLPNEEIEIKDLVDDVLAFCGQRMKNHGVNLRFYGLEKYAVMGHKIQLEQVLLNLLNNSFDAIEFLPDKWIEMSVNEASDKIQIYFKDSGPGIPPEVANRMMEPFYTTKKMGKGTGLGLALARGIVEKHGGSLSYVSDSSHTTFLLELPKAGISVIPRTASVLPEKQLH